MPGPDHAAALLLQRQHEIGQRQPGACIQCPRRAPEGGRGLEMQTAYYGTLLYGPAEQIADHAVVDAANQRADQHDAQSGLAAAAQGFPLEVQTVAPAQSSENGVIQPVPLQIDGIQPGFPEAAGVALFRGQPQTVAVDLQQPKAQFPRRSDALRQEVAQRRAGKLNVARAGNSPQAAQTLQYFIGGQIAGRASRCRGIADGTGHVAALRYFNKAGAGMLGMIRAEAAIVRTALVRDVSGLPGRRGDALRHPVQKIRQPLPLTPDRRAKIAMLRAVLVQKNASVGRKAIGCVDAAQTFRADALRLMQSYMAVHDQPATSTL